MNKWPLEHDEIVEYVDELRLCSGVDCRHPRSDGDYIIYINRSEASYETYCLPCFLVEVIGLDPDEIPRDM